MDIRRPGPSDTTAMLCPGARNSQGWEDLLVAGLSPQGPKSSPDRPGLGRTSASGSPGPRRRQGEGVRSPTRDSQDSQLNLNQRLCPSPVVPSPLSSTSHHPALALGLPPGTGSPSPGSLRRLEWVGSPSAAGPWRLELLQPPSGDRQLPEKFLQQREEGAVPRHVCRRESRAWAPAGLAQSNLIRQ
ncbi:hypothetical protein P7K49_015182 [Saguinus oedipus]|uniref:Uncharacterized protein n=1 Tax=Saguinus oedipus TaxID=9490 RepID=A0ABQ9VAI2_SAGOE|nr:hypothetical protein P7K49_015182 [Saguinus oedipus]